jgi:hypothetical protein
MTTDPVPQGSHGGSRPGAGRPPGSPNTITRDLRAAIIGAFEAKGGQAYLERIADEDPRVFCSLLAKLVPTVLEGNPEAPVTLEILARDFLKPIPSTSGPPRDYERRTAEAAIQTDTVPSASA